MTEGKQLFSSCKAMGLCVITVFSNQKVQPEMYG